MRPTAAAVVAALALAACSSSSVTVADGVTAPPGSTVEVVSSALRGPTQAIIGPGGAPWVAELNGGESDSTGRVVALADDGSIAAVLLDGLDKPTGITLADGFLWVMQRRSLGRVAVTDDGRLDGTLTPVLDELPFNGRSETSLAHTDGGSVLFAVTGDESNIAESGILYEWPPGTTEPRRIASGLKNAYAQVPVDGGVVATEIGDGTFDGGAPLEELNRLQPGDDAGWPACTGDRDPSQDRGATAADCAGTVAPLATFPPQATPTGLASIGPDGDWLVALFTRGEIVWVPRGGGDPVLWASGMDGPQDLLTVDGTVYVTEHGTGRLLAFRPQ